MDYTRRGASKNYGGSYTAAQDRELDSAPPKFVLKEKIKDMTKYGMRLTMNFPRRNRKLADRMTDIMLEMVDLAVRLEKKYYKKTTLEDLDIALDRLRLLVEMASDKDYFGEKYAPPLTIHQRDYWGKLNREIGNMIGGYKKSIEGTKKEASSRA